jgi:predicted permease
MEKRIGALPGVVSVGSVYGAPFKGSGLTSWLWVEGRPEPEPENETSATIHPVTPGYFETMGVPILFGRGIEESDDEGSTPAIVVNETFVRQNFPAQDPIGEQFRIFGSFGFGNPVYTIVGVIPDLRTESVAGMPVPEVYPAQRQVGPGTLTVAVKTTPGLPPPLQAIRSVIHSMDPTLPPRAAETMERLVADDTAAARFLFVLFSLFAGIAVTLSGVGLYGVIAFLASQRRQEIGIRLALGADGGGVVGLMLRQALVPVALGLGLGLAGAWGGTQILQSLLFQVGSRDPLVFIGATGVLLGVALMAALVPAIRASSGDPVQALNTE